MSEERWWERAVVYQVYVRSFADGDGDGIGDLEGLRGRLGHIASLGVDAVWLCPIYPSPQRDHGYDVADYVDIDPEYGDLAAFDRLVGDCQERGLRLLLDVVPNHCSDQHPWFQAALRSPPGSDERARFWFRSGRDGGPPNNWPAQFGGSVWTPVGGDDPEWYLGTFTPYQPDFDHRHPAVAELFEQALRFWFDRGADGFRVDAVWPVGKDPGLPDSPPLGPGEFNPHTRFREEGHEVWRRWRALVDGYMADRPGRDLMLVAEAYTPRRPDILATYTRPDEFHQCFAFDLLLSPWHGPTMRRAITEAFDIGDAQGRPPTITLNNHDTQRTVTRYGRASNTGPDAWTGDNQHYGPGPVDLGIGTRRARAAAGLLLAMPGAVYLYQGEELALPEVLDLPDEARQDPVFARTGGQQIGRDGCRVPLPWTADGSDAFGFSPPGTTAAPWLPTPPGWGAYAVSEQEGDPSSMLSLYRRLIDARRELLGASPAAVLDEHPDLVAFRRGQVVVACNTGRRPVRCDAASGGRALLTTGDEPDGDVVPADTTVWFDAMRRVASTAPMLLANVLTDLTEWLEDVSGEPWFLLVILGIAFFDSIIPIVPSETTVILGGVAAGAGDQNLLLVIAAGALGAFLGDNCAYLIGRRFAPAIQRRADRRPKTARRLTWARTQIKRRGGLLLITARFIPGGRTALTLSSGITHQPWAWFAAWVAVAAVIWASYAAILGAVFGQAFEDNHTLAFILAFGAALSITIIIEVVRHYRSSDSTTEDLTDAVAADSPTGG